MGSPLAPVLAGIFMVVLERAVIPKLHNIFNSGNVMSMTPSVVFVRDTTNLSCHVSIVFITPSNLHIKLRKEMNYPFLTS